MSLQNIIKIFQTIKKLPILNLTSILQCYILLQAANEINASLQKLWKGNQ